MPKALPLILLLTAVGCGPRWETAKEQVLTKIDTLLGEIDLRSRLATASVAELETGVNQLSHARIDVAVRHTRLAEDLTAVQGETRPNPRRGIPDKASSPRRCRFGPPRTASAESWGFWKAESDRARDRLHAVRILLSQIDSKRVALKAIRQAVEVCEAGSLDFRKVESEVRDLETQIDTELEFQELRLNDLNVDWE